MLAFGSPMRVPERDGAGEGGVHGKRRPVRQSSKARGVPAAVSWPHRAPMAREIASHRSVDYRRVRLRPPRHTTGPWLMLDCRRPSSNFARILLTALHRTSMEDIIDRLLYP